MKVALLLLTLFVTIPNQVMSRLSTFLDLPTTAKHHPAFDQHMNRAELQLQREQQSQERLERTREQRERAREKIATATPNDDSQLVRLTTAEVDRYSKQDQPWLRRVSSSGSNWHLASPGTTYEPWQQAYRTLGAFIDCDHSKSSYQNRHNFNYNVNSNGCSRWMMWASVRTCHPVCALVVANPHENHGLPETCSTNSLFNSLYFAVCGSKLPWERIQ